MASTVMVARIAHARSKDLDREIIMAAHISDLESRARTGDVTVTTSVPAVDSMPLAHTSE